MTPGDVKTARTTWDTTRAAVVQPATRAACAVHAACAAQLGGDVLLDHGRDSVPQRLGRRGAYRPDRHRHQSTRGVRVGADAPLRHSRPRLAGPARKAFCQRDDGGDGEAATAREQPGAAPTSSSICSCWPSTSPSAASSGPGSSGWWIWRCRRRRAPTSDRTDSWARTAT